MNIKDIVKKYGGNMEILSEAMEEYVPKEELNKLAKKVYESTQGKHFDEEFAKEQISKMYYEENGRKHYGPYWDDVTSLYAQNKRKLLFPYNKWDFEVTLNMICSDMLPLLKEWFPDDSDKLLEQKMVQLAINWINDEDNPYGESKIWCYFSR